MKDGHRILYRSHVKAHAKVLVQDPCPFGHPIVLTVAPMVLERFRAHFHVHAHFG